MVVSALLTLLNTLKKRVIGTIGATYDYAHWFFYLLLQNGVTALFFPFTILLSLVCICLSVCLSSYVSVCLCECLYVCLYVLCIYVGCPY